MHDRSKRLLSAECMANDLCGKPWLMQVHHVKVMRVIVGGLKEQTIAPVRQNTVELTVKSSKRIVVQVIGVMGGKYNSRNSRSAFEKSSAASLLFERPDHEFVGGSKAPMSPSKIEPSMTMIRAEIAKKFVKSRLGWFLCV